jgi:uncharacterized membrane protein YccC
MADFDNQTPLRHALLTATAAVVCLLVAEVFRIARADLAVWSTYLVTVQFSYTRFQKGIERILGRALGILAGLAFTTWLHDAPILTFLLMAVLLTFFFYVYFAGRLAYTFLQAGLYLVAMFQIGEGNPASAVSAAEGLFVAIVVGVFVGILVSWLFGAEQNLEIELGKDPLLPLNMDWLSQSLMLAVTVILTLFGAHMLDIPPEKAAISVMLLTVTPHVQALIQKGELRIAGAVLASLWAIGTFLIVGLLPTLPLLAALLFLGQFIGAYITRTAGEYSYAGLQMGLVLPMLIVVPRNEFGVFTPAIQRLAGIVLALLASVVVAVLWPRFRLKPEVPPAPVPQFPGEMEV